MNISEAKEYLENNGYKVINTGSTEKNNSKITIGSLSDDIYLNYITNSDLNGTITKHDINVWNGPENFFEPVGNYLTLVNILQNNTKNINKMQLFLDGKRKNDTNLVLLQSASIRGVGTYYAYLYNYENKNSYYINRKASCNGSVVLNSYAYFNYRPLFTFKETIAS